MKTNFKRLFALVLTLCMLASLMVPVAFAEDEAVADPSAIVAETYPVRLKDVNHTDPLTAEGLDKLMVKTNAQGVTKYHCPGYLDLAAYYTDGTLNWKGIATSYEMLYHTSWAWQFRFRGWGALQIRVSNPGLYSLKVTTDKNTYENLTNSGADWAGDVTAYVIPAAIVNDAIANAVPTETEKAEVVGINSLMTEKYSVGTVSMAADDTSVTFAKTRMDGGEYVVVFKASINDFSICEMSLLETAEDAAKFEVTQIANYPIRVIDPKASLADQYVEDGVINKFIIKTTDEAGNVTYSLNGEFKADGTTGTGVGIAALDKTVTYNNYGWMYLDGGCNYRPNFAYQYRLDTAKTATFQIKVPSSGKFALTLSTVSGGNYSADAYVVNVKDQGGAAYAALATAENSIGSATATAGKPAIFETKYYEAGEYIVIISNTTGGNFPIDSMGLIYYPIDEIPEASVSNSQVINTALYEISDPVFDQIVSKSTTFASELTLDGAAITLNDYVDAQYAAGKMNWKVENYADLFTDSVFRFNSSDNGGLHIATVGTSTGDWAALRIRVTVGDRYSIALTSGRSSMAHTTYMFPATSAEMSVEDIEAQMTPANVLYTTAGKPGVLNRKISVGYLDGEYILVFKAPHATDARNVYIDKITLESETFTAEDVQFYNFNLFDETNPYYELVTNRYSKVTEEVTNPETGETSTVTTFKPYETIPTSDNFNSAEGVVVSKDAEGNPTAVGALYSAVYEQNGNGYPKNLNWRPDAANRGLTDNLAQDMKSYSFAQVENIIEQASFGINYSGKASDFIQYGSFMLHVDKAGTYDLSVSVPKYNNYSKIFFVDTSIASYTAQVSDATIQSLIADDTYLVGGDAETGFTFLQKRLTTTVGTVEVDAAGDYLVIFVADNTGEKTSAETINETLYINNITLTPVVEKTVAGVNGETYATIEKAIAAAGEGDTIHLLDNVIEGGEIVVPVGVTLNLNGLYAEFDSVDVASGAQIIDTTDGQALLKGEATFNESNAQLPLFDVNANGYHLYNTEVESCATTGTGSHTKYWFKVNFTNAAAFDMIGFNSELRIMADMHGFYKGTEDPFEAVAYADAAFTNTWAANNSSYIVVSAVGDGINPFRLNPGVTANGVVITGATMAKGSAT